MSIRVHFKDYLQEQIKHRFAKKSALGADNEIFNNFFNSDYQDDEKIIKKIKNQLIFNKNLYFMSSALADAHDVNLAIDPSDQLPEFILKESFSDYMKFSRINEDYFNEAPFASSILKEKFKTVKDNELKVIFIGYGGAVSNILYNFSILSDTFTVDEIFEEGKIFEKDNWALTNILRISKPLMYKSFSKYSGVTSRVSKLLTLDIEKKLFGDLEINLNYLDEENVKSILKEDPNTIFIGAPDFKTRKILAESGAHFIMVGHNNNTISIKKNPTIHETMIETYGTIDVPVLLLNLWAATYKLIDLLADPDQVFKANDNTEFFSFNFDDLNDDQVKSLKEGFVIE
jgi:hypothetical protein